MHSAFFSEYIKALVKNTELIPMWPCQEAAA